MLVQNYFYWHTFHQPSGDKFTNVKELQYCSEEKKITQFLNFAAQFSVLDIWSSTNPVLIMWNIIQSWNKTLRQWLVVLWYWCQHIKGTQQISHNWQCSLVLKPRVSCFYNYSSWIDGQKFTFYVEQTDPRQHCITIYTSYS